MLAGLCETPCCDDVVKQIVSLDLDSLSSVRASTDRCMWCRDKGLEPPPNPSKPCWQGQERLAGFYGGLIVIMWLNNPFPLDLDSFNSVRASTERCMWCRDKDLGPPPIPQTMLARSRHASRALWRPCCDTCGQTICIS